jgi:hypothetical protein
VTEARLPVTNARVRVATVVPPAPPVL